MTSIQTLINGSNELNIDLNDKQKVQFIKYKELLKEWNEKINITAITEDDEIDIKHFLDSLTAFESELLDGEKKIIDIGTGGGFPGVPLKIINDKLDVTLLDSLNKRIKFLDIVIEELGLDNIRAIHGRAEEFSRTDEYREKYDICISRAVASLDTLSEYCIPFVKQHGFFIAMKGPGVEDELKDAKNAIELLGGKVRGLVEVDIPNSDRNHTLLIVEKVRKTPSKYPRGGGKPRKKPL